MLTKGYYPELSTKIANSAPEKFLMRDRLPTCLFLLFERWLPVYDFAFNKNAILIA